MAELKELQIIIEILTKKSLKPKIEWHLRGQKLSILFDNISNGKIKDDMTALEIMDQGAEKKESFEKLKTRLYDTIVPLLSITNMAKLNPTATIKIFNECNRNTAIVKNLINIYARSIAIPLAKRTLTKALKYDNTVNALELSKILRSHYGTIDWNKNLYKKYDAILESQTEIHLLELKIEKYYIEIVRDFAMVRIPKPKHIGISKYIAKELKKILKSDQSYWATLVGYTTITICYEIQIKYRKVIKYCDIALGKLNQKPHLKTSSALFLFTYKKAGSYLHLQNYKEARLNAEACIQIVPENSINWFLGIDILLILNYHTREFSKAFELYNIAAKNPHLTSLPPTITETFKIHEAFINYFIAIGRIPARRMRRFRLGKFLNEVPVYSKDKRGTNITILILHILFLLQRREYDQIIDRMDSLRMYSHRYLRRDQEFRSNCFIKMLLLLVPAGFHRERVRHRGERLLKQLEEMPISKSRQSVELEIVPYEFLWECILDSLGNRIIN